MVANELRHVLLKCNFRRWQMPRFFNSLKHEITSVFMVSYDFSALLANLVFQKYLFSDVHDRFISVIMTFQWIVMLIYVNHVDSDKGPEAGNSKLASPAH